MTIEYQNALRLHPLKSAGQAVFSGWSLIKELLIFRRFGGSEIIQIYVLSPCFPDARYRCRWKDSQRGYPG